MVSAHKFFFLEGANMKNFVLQTTTTKKLELITLYRR